MDENTRFLIERMDEHHREVRGEFKALREEISVLRDFKNKILGMAALVSGVAGLIGSYIMDKIKGS